MASVLQDDVISHVVQVLRMVVCDAPRRLESSSGFIWRHVRVRGPKRAHTLIRAGEAIGELEGKHLCVWQAHAEGDRAVERAWKRA